jgi:hypothetical protein
MFSHKLWFKPTIPPGEQFEVEAYDIEALVGGVNPHSVYKVSFTLYMLVDTHSYVISPPRLWDALEVKTNETISTTINNIFFIICNLN